MFSGKCLDFRLELVDEFGIFLMCYEKNFQKTFKTHFLKIHSLQKQATPDDGL